MAKKTFSEILLSVDPYHPRLATYGDYTFLFSANDIVLYDVSIRKHPGVREFGKIRFRVVEDRVDFFVEPNGYFSPNLTHYLNFNCHRKYGKHGNLTFSGLDNAMQMFLDFLIDIQN